MANIEIIGTNFALDKETFDMKLEVLNFCEKIQIDFMDGEYTNQESIPLEEMSSINNFEDKEFELHLMAKDPLSYLEDIKKLNVKKILFHIEGCMDKSDVERTIEGFKNNNYETFMVVDAKTTPNVVVPFLDKIDGVMFMGVNSGAEGQEFIDDVFGKVEALRDANSTIPIEIDGGVNEKNIKMLVKLGATILSVGSYISSSEDPKANYEKLLSLVNS